jgi:betaine-homocysteine S-methyltransferase
MTRGLIDRIEQDGFVICAEGYVFELERRGYLKAGPFVPEVVLENPNAVKELHREFMLAGSDIVLAFTYYAHRDKMKVIGREGDLEEINRVAVRLAREVASEGDALVAGNLCNTWVFDPSDARASGEIVRQMYAEQIQWAVDEGVDLILAETLNHFGEAEIALELIQETGLPAVICFNPFLAQTGDGYEFDDACKILSERGAAVVGMNCGSGPATMMPTMKKIVDNVDGYTAAVPVPYSTSSADPAFLTLKKDGCRHGFPIELESFLLSRYEMADFAVVAKEMGIQYIGICCGGAPHHVRAMAEALGKTVPASRYSPDLSRHEVFGADDVVKQHNKGQFQHQIDNFNKT